ncbi:MAG: VOC family protein [Desulfarculus sp.]|nr:VOC family protein [Pseudomonadota bacterium]MBV1716026.1 VOC family protein [Desulfarculus sp.]MBU4575171.1 VOC family protein [Pseudomonadota bacterium]MBU4596610.1 VOC family protein [Pseudomonadota bacterium]MBV1738463.1 VOC family protein [Desulfarculus sp.]
MLKPAKDSLDLGVVVSDIEASLAFYRDTLGLSYVGSNAVGFGTLHRLRYGTSDFKLIDPANPVPAGPKGLMASLGLRYVTFVVTNLEEVCQKLAAMGVFFEREMVEIRPGVTIAMVHDPDGNVVEFVQIA